MSSAEVIETGNEAIDKIAKEPNLDFFFFDRNPIELTDDDLRRMIETERTSRAQFISKKDK
jgi:hypothetical protein